MDGTPTSESPMILVLLDTHGEPQILLGEQAGPRPGGAASGGGAAPGAAPGGGKPEAGLQ
jgi:hypothetical protein